MFLHIVYIYMCVCVCVGGGECVCVCVCMGGLLTSYHSLELLYRST